MPAAKRPTKIKVIKKSVWVEDRIVYEGPERRKNPDDIKYGRRKQHIQEGPYPKEGENRKEGRLFVRGNEKGTRWEMTSTRRRPESKKRIVIEE